jgi:uncharacterized protein (DUF58 family)
VDIYQRGVSSLFVTRIALVPVGVCLTAALINGAHHLVFLCLLVFAVMAGLKLWSRSGASNIEFGLEIDKRRLFPGESLRVILTADNRRFLPLSFEAHIRVGGGLRGTRHGDVSHDRSIQTENSLLWFESLRLEWDLRALHRGVHAVGPATLAAGDLLGFYMKQNVWEERAEVIVYPRIVPLNSFSLPKRDFFGIPAGESPVDDPVYILGTIDYHHSRPARHIHWKASARHNRLQQKVFEPTAQEKVLLVVDVSGFSDESCEESFEEMLEVVGSLTARLDGQGCSVGLVTNGAVTDGRRLVPVTRNPFQVGTILEALARMEMRQEMSVLDVLLKSPAISWGTTCVYFAFESTSETDRGRAVFLSRRIPVVFLTCEGIRGLRAESRDGRQENESRNGATAGAPWS